MITYSMGRAISLRAGKIFNLCFAKFQAFIQKQTLGQFDMNISVIIYSKMKIFCLLFLFIQHNEYDYTETTLLCALLINFIRILMFLAILPSE